MSTCATSRITGATGVLPRDYDLTPHASPHPPQTVAALDGWLKTHCPGGTWSGKLYVASTISRNGTGFLQAGCSPNYMVGVWTLTCCKHHMRSAQPLQDALKRGEPVFIFTLAEQDPTGVQWLVSVAKVTQHFASMADYARGLQATGNRSLISSRLSRLPRNNTSSGWRFGDCHSDRKLQIGAPGVDHVHGYNHGHCWADDNAPGHTLLLSRCFLLWPAPVFQSGQTLKQSLYGHNIDPGNLWQLLR